ncbi:hypothetical protein NDN08_002134 [Rhodosorus marinus]|uniref:Elongation of fatty acids protein n=1 Tax=Rhodosorus marinus TaxID=101924 RepID=A0AAV8USZ4_9RHOD|nr:hypothetical protein NDN08_002134 [Rhodosorus marinus]
MNVLEKGMAYLSDLGGDWRYVPGETPLSKLSVAATVVLGYFLVIHVLQSVMEYRKPMNTKAPLIAHNAFLCIASAILFIWLGVTLGYNSPHGRMSAKDTLDFMICSSELHDNGSLHLIYWLNYLLKYYELLDTVFLVLRKKPVMFLHEYHHGATLLLTWSQQNEHSTAQWVPILYNLGVHVAMYYYYILSALKIHVWWKKHLTTVQIIQFIVGVSSSSYAYYRYLFTPEKCHGNDTGAIVGVSVLFSYFILFTRFYFQTYWSMKKTRTTKPISSKSTVI